MGEQEFQVDDEVVVHEPYRRPSPYASGVITKVGRTLVTIEYGGRSAQFRMKDRKGQGRAERATFQTPEEYVRARREGELRTALYGAGIHLEVGRQFPLETLERIAAALDLDLAKE